MMSFPHHDALSLVVSLAICLAILAGVSNVEASMNSNAWSIGVRSGMARWTDAMNMNKGSSNMLLARSSAGDQSYATSSRLNRQEESLLSSPRKGEQSVDVAEGQNGNKNDSSLGRGGAAEVVVRLQFWENMICGAVSRSCAQTVMHPANTMKTLLQSNRDGSGATTIRELIQKGNLKLLTRGAGAQLLMSMPHGAVNFAVLEYVRRQMNNIVQNKLEPDVAKRVGPGLDFASSCISTVACSVVSTPQMMITDNIMAGTYPNLFAAVKGLAAASENNVIAGFYQGWWPGLAGKIPSYALTWTFFQQLKDIRAKVFKRPAKDIENSLMGCLASGTTVCIMIPMDTIKTRLVTQANYPNLVPYKGIVDCAQRVLKEEGVGAFYRGLTPRLISVMPMIGIQFGIYEYMKKIMMSRQTNMSPPAPTKKKKGLSPPTQTRKLSKIASFLKINQTEEEMRDLEAIVFEVGADDEQPFPAPKRHDEDNYSEKKKNMKQKKKPKKI